MFLLGYAARLSHSHRVYFGSAASLSAEHSWSEDLARRAGWWSKSQIFTQQGFRGNSFFLGEYITGRFCEYILPCEKRHINTKRYQSAVWAMTQDTEPKLTLGERASHSRITSQKRAESGRTIGNF